MSAAAAFSGSLAVFCLGTALASARPGPLAGCAAAVIAAAALVRAGRPAARRRASLHLCRRTGRVQAEEGDPGPEFRLIGVTGHLICLVREGRPRECRTVWRDAIGTDGFRRIAAYGRWRRGVAPDRPNSRELITGQAVTGGQSIRRTGRPLGQ